MVFPERVLAQTQNLLLPKVVDNTLKSNVLALRLVGTAKQGKGESIKRPIKYQNSGQATSFSGLDTFVATQLTTKVRLSYDMRGIRIPVAVSGMEAVANAVSETQITDLVQEAVDESELELADALGGYLYGFGLANNQKDPIGISAYADDGSNVGTLGTLSRTQYPVLNGYLQAATSGLMSLTALQAMFTNLSSGSSLSTPSLLVSAPAPWDFYEQLLTPTVRETYAMQGYYKVGAGAPTRGEGLVGQQGFTAVTYKGIPWVRDEKATPGTAFMLNENWLDWYGWNASSAPFGYKALSLGQSTVEGLYSEPPMSQYTGFNWSGFRAPHNQFGGVADIVLLGNLMSWQPRRQGRLTGITGV